MTRRLEERSMTTTSDDLMLAFDLLDAADGRRDDKITKGKIPLARSKDDTTIEYQYYKTDFDVTQWTTAPFDLPPEGSA